MDSPPTSSPPAAPLFVSLNGREKPTHVVFSAENDFNSADHALIFSPKTFSAVKSLKINVGFINAGEIKVTLNRMDGHI